MANKQSYVVEFLGLEVSEAVKGKLVNAEEKLANAVLANTKLRNHVSKIHKILKDNGVEYSTNDLNKCIDSFKEATKETKEGEFSPTKKEVISLDINPDLFSECGLDINLDIEEETDEVVIEEETHAVIEINEVTRTFIKENFDESAQSIVNDVISGMNSSVNGIDNIIYWTLKGNVSLVKLLDNIIIILTKVKGFEENKMIKRFIKPIKEMVKVVDDSIIKLSSMSNVTDIEVLEASFNECVENVMSCLWFMSFVPIYDVIENFVKTILLCCLDSDFSVSTLGIIEVSEIDVEFIDRLFNIFEKNSTLIDLSNVNTLEDIMNISLDIDTGLEEFDETKETELFTVEELINEFTDNTSDENKMIKINPIKVYGNGIGGNFKSVGVAVKNVIFA